VDGLGHVEDDVGPERLATQPECPVDLVVFGADWADGEMGPVDGQGEPADVALVAMHAVLKHQSGDSDTPLPRD